MSKTSKLTFRVDNKHTRRGLSILLFLALFTLQFSGVPVLNPTVLGRPLSIYLLYFLCMIGFVILAARILLTHQGVWKDIWHGNADAKSLMQSEEFVQDVLIFIGVTFSWVVSLLAVRSISRILTESVWFVFPLLLMSVVRYCQLSRQQVIRVLLFTAIIGGIVSLLIATRVLSSTVWAPKDGLVRSAGAVDGTLGLAGAIAAISWLRGPRRSIDVILAMLGLVGSLSILLFGLSRLRIVIFLLILFIYLALLFFKDKSSRRHVILILASLSILLLLLLFAFPDVMEKLMSSILGRLAKLGADNNTTIRLEEMRIHWRLLWDTYGIGQFWGIRQNFLVQGQELFVHNALTGILMHGGLVWGGLYIYFLLHLFYQALCKSVRFEFRGDDNLMLTLLLLALLLVSLGGGGITQTGALYIMCIVYTKKQNGAIES